MNGKRSYTPIAQIDLNLGRRSLTPASSSSILSSSSALAHNNNHVSTSGPNQTSSTNQSQSPTTTGSNNVRTTSSVNSQSNNRQSTGSATNLCTSQTSLDRSRNGSIQTPTESIDLKVIPLRKARNREFRINPDIDGDNLPTLPSSLSSHSLNGSPGAKDGGVSPVHESKVTPSGVMKLVSSPSPAQVQHESSPENETSFPAVKSSSVLEKLSIFEKPKVNDRTSLPSLKPVVKPKSPPGQQESDSSNKLKDGNGVYWADVLKPVANRSISHPRNEEVAAVSVSSGVTGQGHALVGNDVKPRISFTSINEDGGKKAKEESDSSSTTLMSMSVGRTVEAAAATTMRGKNNESQSEEEVKGAVISQDNEHESTRRNDEMEGKKSDRSKRSVEAEEKKCEGEKEKETESGDDKKQKIVASSGPPSIPTFLLDHHLLLSQDKNQQHLSGENSGSSSRTSPLFLSSLAQDSLKTRLVSTTFPSLESSPPPLIPTDVLETVKCVTSDISSTSVVVSTSSQGRPEPVKLEGKAAGSQVTEEPKKKEDTGLMMAAPIISGQRSEVDIDEEVIPKVVESEMEMLNDLLKYINQKIVSLSPSTSEADSDSGIKGQQDQSCNDSNQDTNHHVRDMSLDDTVDGGSDREVKRRSINSKNSSIERRRSKRKSYREDILDSDRNNKDKDHGDNATDEGIVVGTLNPSSGDSLDHVLDMTFFKSTPDGRKKKNGHHHHHSSASHKIDTSLSVAGQRGRSPSTEPSGNYSLTTTTTDEDEEGDDGDGEDESSLEDRLNEVGINDGYSSGTESHPNVIIRSPGLVGRNDSSRSRSSQGAGRRSPLVSFNDLSVIEMESFLSKHRRTERMKDEGKDTILYLPDFIQNAMNFLTKHGIRKEGIFRRSGVKSRINLLVQNNSSLNNLDHACPYDVADFLKGWFRNQVPLLPASLVSTLLPLLNPTSSSSLVTPSSSSSSSSPLPSDGHHSNNRSKQNPSAIPDVAKLTSDDLNRLRAHLMVFPNRLAIESLFRFLYKISQFSDYNSMTVSNLAIVWTPSLCREESASMASMINAISSPVTKSNGKNKASKSDHQIAGSVENQIMSKSAKMTPSQSVSSNNFLLESVSNFMKDSRVLVEFLITNVDTLFCISRGDLVLPSPPVSVVIPSAGPSVMINCGRNSRPSSKTSTIDSRNGGSLRLSSFATHHSNLGNNDSSCSSPDHSSPASSNKGPQRTESIPRGIRPPSIGCRRFKVIPNASPYDIFLRIILERRTWDPLVTEIIDEGSGVQKIKHSFSSYLRPSSSVSNGGSLRANGQNRYTRCKSLTRSTNSPCHRRSVSTSSSDSRRRTSSRGSSLAGHNDCDVDDCSDQTRYLTIRRKWPDKLDPSVQVIQIHEESLDDPSSRTKTSTGMPSYICDWFIKAGPPASSPSKNGTTGGQPSSEINVAIYADLKGRPLCWYSKSFPRLIDCYLNRISSFFNQTDSSSNPDGILDVIDTSMTTFGANQFQPRGAGNRGPRRVATFDPFCCISMKHVVQSS